MMEENVVFKTAAVGGFEKRAVLDYIYKMNEQTEGEKEELQREIKELEETIASGEESTRYISVNLRSLERDLSTKALELAEEKRIRQELVATTEELNAELARYRDKLTSKELETKKFIDQNKAMFDQNKSIEEQQAELDKASYQLGRVMLDARTDADAIVAGAKEQAEDLIAQTEADLKAQRSQVDDEIRQLQANAQQQVKIQVDTAKAEADQTIDDAKGLADMTVSTAKNEADAAIGNARERVSVIVSTGEEVADSANLQMRDLRRETTAIRKAVQEAFEALQQKADRLDEYIEKAQGTLTGEHTALLQKKVAGIPELNLVELKRIYLEKKEKDLAYRPKQPLVAVSLPLEDLPEPQDSDSKDLPPDSELQLKKPEEQKQPKPLATAPLPVTSVSGAPPLPAPLSFSFGSKQGESAKAKTDPLPTTKAEPKQPEVIEKEEREPSLKAFEPVILSAPPPAEREVTELSSVQDVEPARVTLLQPLRAKEKEAAEPVGGQAKEPENLVPNVPEKVKPEPEPQESSLGTSDPMGKKERTIEKKLVTIVHPEPLDKAEPAELIFKISEPVGTIPLTQLIPTKEEPQVKGAVGTESGLLNATSKDFAGEAPKNEKLTFAEIKARSAAREEGQQTQETKDPAPPNEPLKESSFKKEKGAFPPGLDNPTVEKESSDSNPTQGSFF